MNNMVLATKNEGKRKELEALLAGTVTVYSLRDYPGFPDVAETGETFAANARLKAEAVSEYTGLPALADDSGLAVDALDGAPGVYSARFAGEDQDDEKNNDKLLTSLEGKSWEERTARFICVLVYMDINGTFIEVEGTCEGNILSQPKGTNGFGYDPLMYIPQLGKALAELPSEEKNRISHRSQALKKMKAEWRKAKLY